MLSFIVHALPCPFVLRTRRAPLAALVTGALTAAFVVAASGCAPTGRETDGSQTDDSEPGWAFYGGDAGGTRFSNARAITTANVAGLVKAWEYRTGELKHTTTKAPSGGQCAECHQAQVKLEATPILADDKKVVAKEYGVLKRFLGTIELAKRDTYLIDPAGRIVRHYADVDPKGHSEMVLKDIKELQKKPS